MAMQRQRRGMKALLAAGASLAALAATPAAAQDGTWSANPSVCPGVTRCDYNAPGNWGPAGVPTGTATFGATSISDIEFVNPVGSPPITVGRFLFTAAAPAYTFRLQSDELTFTGDGIVNNSSATQSFIVGNRSTLRFANSSSAGNASLLAEGSQGRISFENNSNAGTAQITIGAAGFGRLEFRDNSSAANATISNPFGNIFFLDNSTAGNAQITNLNGTSFSGASSLGTATITNRIGLRILQDATGPSATIINEAAGLVDISQVDGGAASTAIGSLSGAGNVTLGGRNLTLGALNRDDIISGVISDGGDLGGTGGSLTKIGTGTLTLSGASTYTGATTVSGGTLLLTGSITGSGPTAIGVGAGTNGRLTIQSGGTLTTTGDARIGEAGGNGTVTVTGAGSSWTVGGGLNIANSPVSNHVGRLIVENGATVTSASAGILRQTNIQTADGAATISGAGSVWNSGTLTIQSSTGTTVMTIQSGGRVNSGAVNLAGGVLATGAGTVWNTGNLIVGPNLSANGTPPGRLTIAGGAVVNSTSAVIADGGGGFSSVTIDGAGSAWNTGTNLVLAPAAFSGGQVSVLNGGALTVAGGTGTIAVGPNGGASFFTVGGGAPGTTAGIVNAASVLLGPGSILSFEYAGSTGVFAPTITGSGRIFVGGGTTILAANSTAFAGTTTIFAGATLQLGSLTSCCGGGVVIQNGGQTGSIAGDIINNGALVISRGIGTVALDGIISGSGSLTQNGNPSMTISRQNGYTGATTINGGAIFVTGSIASSSGVTVNGGGRLGGTGTVARTTVNGGGTLLPGAPLPPGGVAGALGTLSIAGDLTLTNANYVADIAPATADRIVVTGAATLAGRLAAVAGGGSYAPGQYTLLTAAGGRTGTFGSFAIVGNFGGLFASLSYTGSDVILSLAPFGATDEERWLAAPATNLWNSGSNWNPDAVPIGTARFGPSSHTTIVFSPGTTQIGRLLFDADAPAYAFNLDSRIISQGGGSSMNVLGQGVVNNSAFRPTFFVNGAARTVDGGGGLNFFNASSAGNARISNFNSGAGTDAFMTTFYGTSTAANALIENVGAGTAFRESSTAGNATIDNGAGVGFGGTAFFDTSNAGTATIDNEELGGLAFFDNASAASSIILNRATSSYGFGRGGGSSNVGLRFEDTSTAGSARITNDGGSTGFFDTSTAANAIIVNSGGRPSSLLFNTVFADSSSAGSASITNNQDGVTVFFQQGSAATSTIVNNQGGSTEFYGAASAASATITNNEGGTTRFRLTAQGGGATIVSNAGGIVDISEDPQQTPSLVSASVSIGSLSGAGNVFLGSRNLILGALNRNETIAGVIADGGVFGGAGGSLTKTGAGTLILSGANTYTGATTIAAGTLQLGDGGASGSIAGNIANNAAFVINRTGALTLAGVISGSGTFTQNGTVTTTLTAANTYTGATVLNGGALLVTGALASAVRVNNGATLGGTGTVGTTGIASGGTLSPGLSIGMLSIGGNLSFASGSNFLVEVGPATADRVNVSGTATLAGTLTALALGGTYDSNSQYVLLAAAGGLTGTFNSLVTQGSFSGLVPTLRYDGNSVILVFAAAGPTNTATTTLTDALVFNAPTITVQRVGLFETRIIGRLAGGMPLFDQTFNDAFNSAAVQNGLTAARAAITLGGGPGIVIISDPVLISRTISQATSSSSVFSLAGSSQTVMTVTTFGPATVAIGDARSCGAAIGALPSGSRPSCGPPRGTQFTVDPGTVNINTVTRTDYLVNEARTDTITETTRETYELTGTVAAIGTVHAAVQSGVYDLASRFLTRIGGESSPGLFGEPGTPANDGVLRLAPSGGGGSAWAETYGFRNRADARGGIAAERRDAWGLAGGFSLSLAPGLALGFGVDHGRLDLAVPGAGESADVELTQIAATARFGSGPFGFALAAVHGFGSVDSVRNLMGLAAGSYDVNLWGASAEASYRFEAGAWRIVPRLALDHVRIESDAFVESGALGLSAPPNDRDRTRASAGLEVGRSFAIEAGGRIDLAAWGRYVAVLGGEERTLPVAFNLAPGTPLVMRGLPERDSLALGAQLGIQLTPRLGFYGAYDGRFASGYDAHGLVAGLRLAW